MRVCGGCGFEIRWKEGVCFGGLKWGSERDGVGVMCVRCCGVEVLVGVGYKSA